MRLIALLLCVASLYAQAPQPEESKTQTDQTDQTAQAAQTNKSNKTNRTQHTAESKKKLLPEPFPPVVSVTQMPPVTIANWPPTEHRNPWLDAAVANWPLIVIGLFATFAVLGALVVIGRQTQALINAERAWLVVDRPLPYRITLSHTTDWGGNAPWFVCDFKNFGRTVANVRRPIKYRFALLSKSEELPARPNYKTSSIYTAAEQGKIVPPNERYGEVRFSPDDLTISPDILSSIERGESLLYFYALVQYSAITKKLRSLQFCYKYEPGDPEAGIAPLWELAGPPAYNKHT